MGAPALQWTIAKSKLPPFLKLTLHTLALVAEPEQGFANIYFSKGTIGALSSRSERIAAEDVSDLVRFGVLEPVFISPGGRPNRERALAKDPRLRSSSTYKLILSRLGTWTDEDTRKLAEIRRFRRERYPKKPNRKPGSVQQGIRRKRESKNPDVRIRETLIRTSGKAGSVHQTIALGDLPSESTDDAGDRRPVHAVENELAGAAESLGESVHSSSSPRAGADDGAAFRQLAECGRRLLAESGEGPIAWSELAADLRAVAVRLGFASDLTDRVVPFLEIQNLHFRENAQGPPDSATEPGKGVPAPPSRKSRVRPSGEVSP